MRLAVSRAVAIETSRGWRIAKEKQSHKIDIVVALAMAAHATIEGQSSPPMRIPPELLAKIQAMPPNPKYAQHGGPGRYMQHGREQYYERLLGERRYGQLRRGILPGMKPEP